MESPLTRYTTLAAISAAHAGLLWLSVSSHAAAVTPPAPLPMQIVAVATPAVPKVQPAPPKPNRATPQKQKATQKTTPLPVQKVASKAITTPMPATPVSSNTIAQTDAIPNDHPAAPAESAAPAPLIPPTHIGGHLGNPRPAYPPLSIEMGEAGAVALRVAVNAEGKATDVSIARSSGFPRLDRAALQAVRNWRFRPAMRGNEAISYSYTFSVEFDLKKA